MDKTLQTYWRLGDIARCPPHVRYQELSRHHTDVIGKSLVDAK
jgi:hypothetical protein